MDAKIRASRQDARNTQSERDNSVASAETEQVQTDGVIASPLISQQLDSIRRIASPSARQNIMRSIGKTYGNNRAATVARQITQTVQRAPTATEAGGMSETAQSAALQALKEGIAAGLKSYALYDKAFWAAHPEMNGKGIGTVTDTATRDALKADYKYIVEVLYPQAKAAPQAAPETPATNPETAPAAEPGIIDQALESASAVLSGIADTVSGAWDSFTGWLGGGSTETPAIVPGTPAAPGATPETPGTTPGTTPEVPSEQPAATPELSGSQWVSRYPDPKSLDSLNDDFREDAKAFVKALEDAGADVSISSTLRPIQRSYLMYWASIISLSDDPEAKAALAQADKDKGSVAHEITWSHGDAKKTKDAADAMRLGYRTGTGAVGRTSNHNGGGAMDITISWSKKLTIKGKDGSDIQSAAESGLINKANTSPDSGIMEAGRSYGIYNYHDTTNGSSRTKPDGVHWSRTGG